MSEICPKCGYDARFNFTIGQRVRWWAHIGTVVGYTPQRVRVKLDGRWIYTSALEPKSLEPLSDVATNESHLLAYQRWRAGQNMPVCGSFRVLDRAALDDAKGGGDEC